MRELDRLHERYCRLVGHAERLAEAEQYEWSAYYYGLAEDAWKLYQLAVYRHKRGK